MAGPDHGPVPVLDVVDLNVIAPDGRAILRVPSLGLAPGEILGLSGPSGAGKSTLLYALAGLASGASGTVRWGGLDVLGATDTARSAFRRDVLGFVFQDHHLFEEMSTLANAGLAQFYARPADRAGIARRAAAALSAFGLDRRADHIAATLSGGERQRAAVARALATDPAVVLADEPTAALDRDTAARVADDLFGWARAHGRSMIVVSHDPSVLERADRRLALHDGKPVRVVSDG